MTTLTRRKALTAIGIVPVAMAVPVVRVAAQEDPLERIRRLSAELVDAMRVVYGDNVRICSWGPHNPDDLGQDGSTRAVFVSAHSQDLALDGRAIVTGLNLF